jgi:hypothetical protein
VSGTVYWFDYFDFSGSGGSGGELGVIFWGESPSASGGYFSPVYGDQPAHEYANSGNYSLWIKGPSVVAAGVE